MGIPALREMIEERKTASIEKLSESYAKNRLPLEEYERLVEYINKIESERELVVVEKIVAEYDEKNSAGKPVPDDDDEDDDGNVFAGPRQGQSSNSNLAVLSSRNYSGPVRSGSQFVSLLGSQHIKIGKKDLQKRKTVLHMFSVLGDNVIFVEGGIRVRNNVVPILGSADVNQKVSKMSDNSEPELVIKGVALLGEISVKLLKE